MIRRQAVKSLRVFMSSEKNDFYNDLPRRIDTILGDDYHLHRLKQLADARQAFIKEFELDGRYHVPPQKFANWLLERWGVQLRYSESVPGELGMSGYDVVDEQKHLLFCMVFP